MLDFKSPIWKGMVPASAVICTLGGYAVLEGEGSLVAYGRKTVNDDKNAHSLALIDKMIVRYQPDALILYDANAKGIHRWPRIKELHRAVVNLAKQRKLKATAISGIEVRRLLLGDAKGTKYAAAELVASQFPDELALRLPPKRKWYNTEDGRMDIFDAVALVIAFRFKKAA